MTTLLFSLTELLILKNYSINKNKSPFKQQNGVEYNKIFNAIRVLSIYIILSCFIRFTSLKNMSL